MSKKTFKRISLGVIISMVLAPFAVVAPASAAQRITTSITTNVTSIIAGTDSVTVSVVFPATIDATNEDGLVVVTPTGARLYAGSEVANTGGLTGPSATTNPNYVIPASSLLVPGTYTITAVQGDSNSDVDTVAEIDAFSVGAGAKSTTLTVLSPATATNPAANTDAATYTQSSDPVIRVWRNTNLTAGVMHLEVVTSPDTGYVSGAIINPTSSQGGANNVAAVSLFTMNGFTDPNAAVGTYSFIAFIDANGDGVRQSTEPQTPVSFIISGAAASVALTADKTVVNGAVGTTIRMTATVTDALGRPATLTLGTAKLFTRATNGDLFTVAGENVATATAGITLAAAGFAQVGSSNVYIADLVTSTNITYTAGTFETAVTVTVDIDGSDLSTADRGTRSITSVNVQNATAMQVDEKVGLIGATNPIPAAVTGAGGTALTADPAAVTSLMLTVEGPAGRYVEITTAAGVNTNIANIAGAGFYKVLADGEVRVPITFTTPANLQSFTITVTGGRNYVVSFATAAPAWTVGPNANYTLKTGESSTLTGVLRDQYFRPYASKPVTITVVGRNAATVGATTSATGSVSITVADTYSAAVLTTDTVTFSYVESTTVSATASRTITYTATGIVAATATVTDDVNPNLVEIDQAEVNPGFPTSIVNYTVTARTSTGANVGAGALVTWTAGANDIFVNGINSSVTNANGEATIQVFRRLIGAASVTAAVGGATGANSLVTFGNLVTDVRHVLVENNAKTGVLGTLITFTSTVTDRWGNPVAGVEMAWSEIGTGRFVYPAQPSAPALTFISNAAGKTQIDLRAEETELPGGSDVRVCAPTASTQVLDRVGFVGGVAVTDPAGVTSLVAHAGNRCSNTFPTTASATAKDNGLVTWTVPAAPVVEPDAPSLSVAKSKDGKRVFLTGTCVADEGDVIFYVKNPGGAWQELAKTAECFAGEFDANRKMPKNPKLFRVKQEGTGLFSNSVLVRP